MAVVQGGGVTYDAGAAVREAFKNFATSLQNLAMIRQEEAKHKLNVLDQSYKLLEFSRQASGLPMQVFLGTELAKAPLSAMLQAYSAASGRQMTGDEAQEMVNRIIEYNSKQENYNNLTWVQFLLSQKTTGAPEETTPTGKGGTTTGGTPETSQTSQGSGPVGQAGPPSGPTPNAVQSGKVVASGAAISPASSTLAQLQGVPQSAPTAAPVPQQAPVPVPQQAPAPAPAPVPPGVTPQMVGAPGALGNMYQAIQGVPQQGSVTNAVPPGVPPQLVGAPSSLGSANQTVQGVPMQSNSPVPAPAPNPTWDDIVSGKVKQTPEQIRQATQTTPQMQAVSVIQTQLQSMVDSIKTYAAAKGVKIPKEADLNQVMEFAQNYKMPNGLTLIGDFLTNGMDQKKKAETLKTYQQMLSGAKSGAETVLNGIVNMIKAPGVAVSAALGGAAALAVWLQNQGIDVTSLLQKVMLPNAGGSSDYQQFEQQLKSKGIAVAEGLGGVIPDTGHSYQRNPTSSEEILGMYQRAFPRENLKSMDDVRVMLEKYPERAIITSGNPYQSPSGYGQISQVATNELKGQSSIDTKTEIPKEGGGKVVVDVKKAAAATKPDQLLKATLKPIDLTYTGPKAYEHDLALMNDPTKLENVKEKLLAFAGAPTASFKAKSEAHIAAVTAGNWLNTGWKMMTPEERLNLIKQVKEEVKKTTADVGFFSLSPEWSNVKLTQGYYEMLGLQAMANQMQAQASLQGTSIKEVAGIVSGYVSKVLETLQGIYVAGLQKGMSPEKMNDFFKSNSAFKAYMDALLQNVNALLESFGAKDILKGITWETVKGGFLNLFTKDVPVVDTGNQPTGQLSPEAQKALNDIVNGGSK